MWGVGESVELFTGFDQVKPNSGLVDYIIVLNTQIA